MIKNAIIGVLALLSLFLFFYALTQQIKAEQLTELRKGSFAAKRSTRGCCGTSKETSRIGRLELERASQAR